MHKKGDMIKIVFLSKSWEAVRVEPFEGQSFSSSRRGGRVGRRE